MHKEWKEELDEICLSDQQKKRMKRGVYEKKPRKTHRFVPIVLPVFVVVALFAIWLTMGSVFTEPRTASPNIDVEDTHEIFVMATLLWTLFAQLLVGLVYGLGIAVALKVPRLQRYAFWRYVAMSLKTKRVFLLVFVLIACMLAIVFMTLNVSNPTAVLDWLIVIGLLMNVMLTQLLLTRNNGRSCCPHCEEPITAKQFFTLHMTKCKSCNEKIYYARKNSKDYFLIQYLGMAIGFCLLPMLNFSVWHMIVFLVPYLLFVVSCLIPYTMYYCKENEEMQPPLW